MLTADRNITFIAAYHHLLTICIRFSGLVKTKYHTGFTTAEADGFQFDKFIRSGEQILAPFKKLAAEIRAQAITQHGDIKLIDYL